MYEYHKILLSLIPQDIIDKYNPTKIYIYGFIYLWVGKVMYGMVQYGTIAQT